MKKIINAVQIVLIAVMIAAVSCCGSSQMKRIEGNWTLSMINGATLDVYTAATGYSADLLDRNVEINGGKMVVSGMEEDDSNTYGIKVVSEGFELTENSTVIGTAAYSEENDILTLILTDHEEDLVFTFALKRGTYIYNSN